MGNNITELTWNKNKLWEGCLLASIAHAIMVSHYPDLSNEHSWDGINYSVQDSAGTRGTVTFHQGVCVAAFRNDNSDRFKTEGIHPNAFDYFSEATEEIVKLAEEEALQYLLDKVEGKTVPVITAAFWSVEDKLLSEDLQDDLLENGGFLLVKQVMDIELGKDAWKKHYNMSQQQCDLLESIYQRKVSNPSDSLVLSNAEMALIGTDDPEGLNESKASFEEIGIECKG